MMNPRELNQKFMKAFGLGNTGPLLLQEFTVHFRPDDLPLIEAKYVNIDNVIDDELEKIMKTFTLKELDDTISDNIG